MKMIGLLYGVMILPVSGRKSKGASRHARQASAQ